MIKDRGTAPTVRLEIGKWYADRTGGVRGPLSKHPHEIFCFADALKGKFGEGKMTAAWCWTRDGSYWIDGSPISPFDLIEEVPAPTIVSGETPTPQEQPTKTLRDEFAMAALAGLLTRYGAQLSSDQAAESSYRMADAMLSARKGGSK